MRARILLIAWIAVSALTTLCGQISVAPKDYTPDEIGKIRLDYAREGRYEEWISMFRKWEREKGAPATHQDSAVSYALQAAFAYTYFDLRELDSAEAVLKPVLDISIVHFPEEYLKIQNAWGVRLIYGGRFVDSRKHYEKLRVLLDTKQLPSTPQQYCNTVHNLGVSNLQVGDYDAALEVFHHLEDIIHDNDIDDNRLKANLQLNLAGCYSHIKQDKLSLEHSKIAFEICLKEHGLDHPFTAQTLNSVANGLQQTGDLEGALQKYHEVLDIYERIGRQEHPLRTVALLNIAETLDKLGRSQEAMEYVGPCIAIRLKAYGIRHSEVARAFKSKGRILGHLDRFDEALMSLDTALLALGYDAASENPYSGVDAMFNLFYTLDHKADLYYDHAMQNPSKENLLAAKDAYVHGINVLNDLRIHFKGKLSKGTLNQKSYMFYEPAIEVCLKLYEMTGDIADIEQAMKWSSESKGNDFFDLIRGSNAMLSAKVPDSIRTKDEKYQQDLAELESAWYDAHNEDGDEEKLSEARQSLDEAKQQYRVWLGSVEQQYPKYYDLLHAKSELNIKERQHKLVGTSSQLIEYFVGDSSAFAFVLTPEDMHCVQLPHPDSINYVVRAWRENIAGAPLSNTYMLYRTIWQPLTPYLDKNEHLVIIPDGILSTVPFEILQDEQANLLLQQFDISYDYSSRGLTLHTDDHRNQKLLGMAPEYSLDRGSLAMASRGLDSAALRLRDVEWMKLPGAAAEVNAICDLTKGERRIGKSATEGFFRKMAGMFGILHLSMHAWTDDDEPLLSTLIFSDDDTDSTIDGRLYAHEIFQLDLPARLTVLSACNTGVGAFKRGEGISSLARAFMYAGTEATVMSLWKVPDESTAQIMKAFYQHLRAGERKDEALRHAKLDYLQSVSEPELKRPYYWAGFVLMGDPAPVYGGGFPVGIAGIIGGVLLLGGLIVWMKKRGVNS